MFQTLKKLSKVVISVLVLVSFYFAVSLGIRVYQTELGKAIKARESHDLCHDTPKQLAWVAYRDGEARCFLEGREYPHRIKAGNLD